MYKLSTFVSKCAHYVEQAVKFITITLLCFLVLIVFFQVARRILINKSIIEIEELSIVLASWCAFFAVAYSMRKKAHVRIDVFTNKLPFSIGHTLSLIIYLLIFVISVILVRFGFLLAQRKMNVPMTVLPFDSGIWYLSFPVGMTLTSFFTFDNILQEIVLLRSKKDALQDLEHSAKGGM